MKKFDSLALSYAGAITSAIIMVILSLSALAGFYEEAAAQMVKWHEFYSLSFSGIITGAIEASIISFVFLYIFGFVYNKFSKE